MPQIDRPAIAAIWPTLRGELIVLDVGATIGADAQHLVDLAIMGAAMARIVFDIDRPTVGLLNVGVEEIKGLEEVKAAGRVLREAGLPHLDYHGFVEGDDLGKGTVDVIVTEGFTGNIALKTAEGTAKQIGQYIRDAMSHSLHVAHRLFSWRAALSTRCARRWTPRKVNGGVFLGLDGVVIKSHGGADAEGFAGAIEVGYDMVRQELLAKIREMIAQANEARAQLRRPLTSVPEGSSTGLSHLMNKPHSSFGRARRRRLPARTRADQRRTRQEWSTRRTNGSSSAPASASAISPRRARRRRSSPPGPREAALADAGLDGAPTSTSSSWRPRPPITRFPPSRRRFRPISASITASPSICRRCAPASSSR